MRILVTGGAGFIGSNFVHWVIRHQPEVSILNLDALTYAGNVENLRGLPAHRHELLRGDIRRSDDLAQAFSKPLDAVVHFAAESHVDRSILSAQDFLTTNVLGTQLLIEAARQHGVPRFVHVSTDEVYGSLGPHDAPFTEQHPLRPNSPYAASKASSDLMVRAAVETFGFPAVTTRCSNNYGPYQFPEKLMPLFITNALEGRPLPLYGDGMNVRDWIHVEDHARAVWLALTQGRPGEVYNIGGKNEQTNRDITEKILALTGANATLIQPVADRLGHDRRYAIDPTKAERELGFSPAIPFDDGLRATVEWYRSNGDWWRAIKSGEYLRYYDQQYGKRLS